MTTEKNQDKQGCGCPCCGGGKGLSGKAWLIVAVIVLLVVVLAVWSNAA